MVLESERDVTERWCEQTGFAPSGWKTLPRAEPLPAGQTQPRNLFPAGPRECFLLVVSDFKGCPS